MKFHSLFGRVCYGALMVALLFSCDSKQAKLKPGEEIYIRYAGNIIPATITRNDTIGHKIWIKRPNIFGGFNDRYVDQIITYEDVLY